MATNHTSTDRPHMKLAALAISATLLAACGSTSQGLSGTAQNEQRATVVRDLSNPYWVGSPAYESNHTASAPSVIHATIIRDPENPYWQMSKVPVDTYVDPIRGDH